MTGRLPARACCVVFRDDPEEVDVISRSSPFRMATIAELNDAHRRAIPVTTTYVTAGVAALPSDTQARILERVRTFDAFTEDNDPWQEHDFGAFEIDGQTFNWKIDCYDVDLRYASPDPTDPFVTRRVLTIMFASEY